MRKKPYTEAGIKRVPCLRCKAPSARQWQICADGNQWRGVCLPCDVELNHAVLTFMGDLDIEVKMKAYKESLL